MAGSFEQGAKRYLGSKNKSELTAGERRMLRVFNLPTSDKRRGRIINRWQRATVDHLKDELKDEWGERAQSIDWESIDWAALISKIIKILMAILALFGL